MHRKYKEKIARGNQKLIVIEIIVVGVTSSFYIDNLCQQFTEIFTNWLEWQLIMWYPTIEDVDNEICSLVQVASKEATSQTKWKDRWICWRKSVSPQVTTLQLYNFCQQILRMFTNWLIVWLISLGMSNFDIHVMYFVFTGIFGDAKFRTSHLVLPPCIACNYSSQLVIREDT